MLAPAVTAANARARAARSSPRTARVQETGDVTEVRSSVRRSDRVLGVPRVIVPPSRVRDLPIDPRVAFVLSRIDGHSPVETLVDVTGFERSEVVTVLARLVALGAVAMGSR
jgi:hypothetical protein